MKCFLCLLLAVPVWMNAQIVTTIAGNGNIGYSGDGGPATDAVLSKQPGGIAVDGGGNVFFADWFNNVVRKISTDGIITTVAGNGFEAGVVGGGGYTGDGGPATDAEMNGPADVVIDLMGNLYISDGGNNVVRKVSTHGIITTAAGTGSFGYNGDNIPATEAELNSPAGMAFDSAGNLYIADQSNSRIRKINRVGIITTVAGKGTLGFSGDGGPATEAELKTPAWVAVSPVGEIYVADDGTDRIREIDHDGIITTVAGIGSTAVTGDGDLATSAAIAESNSIVFDAAGNFYFGAYGSCKIREVRSLGSIFTYCGTDTCGFSGDGGPATAAEINDGAFCTAVDGAGNIYFSDGLNHRIRKITFDPVSVGQVAAAPVGVSIFPNPAANTVTISLATGITSAEVLNALGHLVLSAQSASADKELRLDVSLLPVGVYLVKVDGLYAGRFAKE